MQKRLATLISGTAITTLVLTGCTSGVAVPTTGGASSAPADGVTTLTLAAVPTLDSMGLLEIAKEQGYLGEAGLEVQVIPLDAGPNVITGVVAGQYDIGATAYAPPLLALAEGAPVRIVSNLGTVGADGTNGGVLVRSDAGIDRWSDLAGKRVASNAPRSLFSLTVPAAVQKDGGDPSGIEIVPLPFNQIPKAVESGEVDAGAILEPFQTDALTEFPDLTNLGDSIAQVLPEGSGSGVLVTSQETKEKKADELAAFTEAIHQAADYANEHPNELKSAGAPLAGLSPERAEALPDTVFSTGIAAGDLEPLVELMAEHSWVSNRPDLDTFLS